MGSSYTCRYTSFPLYSVPYKHDYTPYPGIAEPGRKAGFVMVAGTVYAPDWYRIPTVSVHWICIGVKQGAKKMKRIGIVQ